MKARIPHADRASIAARIGAAAEALDRDLEPLAVQHLVQWIDLLVRWNQKIDLTAARSLEELVDLCVADAFVLARSIGREQTVVDVGSGGGAPGLPLALVRPDLDVTLVEPLTKRVSFLRTTLGLVGARVELRRGRGEPLAEAGRTWDVAVSRATLEPSAWLRLGLQLCDPAEGKVAVLLARQPVEKPDHARLAESISYLWPLTHVQRKIDWYVASRSQQKAS